MKPEFVLQELAQELGKQELTREVHDNQERLNKESKSAEHQYLQIYKGVCLVLKLHFHGHMFVCLAHDSWSL